MNTSTLKKKNVSNIAVIDMDTAQAMVDKAVREALSAMLNKMHDMQSQLDEQQEIITKLQEQSFSRNIKSTKKPATPKVKEKTIKELKQQATELGIKDKELKKYGSKTKKSTWEQAIASKLTQTDSTATVSSVTSITVSDNTLESSSTATVIVNEKENLSEETLSLINLNPFSESTIEELLDVVESSSQTKLTVVDDDYLPF